MKVKILPAIPQDWQVIQNLNNHVFLNDQKHDPDLNMNWPFSKAGVSYYKQLANGKHGHCLIAKIGDKPVGYVAVAVKDFGYRKSKYVELENIGVLPEFRSQGIGQKLMAAVKKWAKQQQAQKLYVAAYWKNKKAVKFYKNCGFAPMGIELEMNI